MTWSVEGSGTQAASIGTEHTLNTPSSPNATFLLNVDTSAMVAGDILELRVYNVVLAAGAVVQEWLGIFNGPQVSPFKPSPFTVINQSGAKFTLKQTAGVGRSYPFSVLKQ